MSDFVFHSGADLQQLGERIRAKAVAVSLEQEQSYSNAQIEANNDENRYRTGEPTRSTNFHPVNSGSADDMDNVRRYLNDAYAHLPRLFTSFAVPDPAGMEPTLQSLYRTAQTLQPSFQVRASGARIETQLQTAGTEPGTTPIGEVCDFVQVHMGTVWSGDAALNFESYISQVKASAGYQVQLAISLANGIEAMRAIRQAMLTDIWEIGDKTLKALDELDNWCGNSAQQTATLTIFGALLAVAFVVSDGAAAVGVEGVQSVATALSAAQGIAKSNEPIGGATVPPVLTGMVRAIEKLRAGVDQQEQSVAKAMTAVSNSVGRQWSRVAPPVPADLAALNPPQRSRLEETSGFHLR